MSLEGRRGVLGRVKAAREALGAGEVGAPVAEVGEQVEQREAQPRHAVDARHRVDLRVRGAALAAAAGGLWRRGIFELCLE